jgi:hypothetical protein
VKGHRYREKEKDFLMYCILHVESLGLIFFSFQLSLLAWERLSGEKIFLFLLAICFGGCVMKDNGQAV